MSLAETRAKVRPGRDDMVLAEAEVLRAAGGFCARVAVVLIQGVFFEPGKSRLGAEQRSRGEQEVTALGPPLFASSAHRQNEQRQSHSPLLPPYSLLDPNHPLHPPVANENSPLARVASPGRRH